MTTIAKDLRRQVKAAKGPSQGSVVAFTRTKDIGREEPLRLSYVAIFVAGRWYFTGTTGVGASAYTHGAFVEFLAGPDISDIRVATEWEAL